MEGYPEAWSAGLVVYSGVETSQSLSCQSERLVGIRQRDNGQTLLANKKGGQHPAAHSWSHQGISTLGTGRILQCQSIEIILL